MKIAVYCGSGTGNRACYAQAAEELGRWIGANGHTLVYGGAAGGLMGITADAVLAEGGKVTGVVPEVELILKRMHTGITETIRTGTMAERKSVMMDLADGYVALPGGPGTLDELSDILSLQRLGLEKPLVLVDTEGFWQPLKTMLDGMVQAAFVSEADFSRMLVSDNMTEIAAFLEGKSPKE